ncbi:hypothetical protein M4D55_23150 [Metabacillus idriensis]|uniref:hypothetical protein n=1 Tax=Metabacillus idriensis TaxID=324768 RepID=UPI00203A7BEF|nr:hypothetical protein [Metabacillus idriensis]MCM3598659.1 hypothetical protein [Metabacillus idriensis]
MMINDQFKEFKINTDPIGLNALADATGLTAMTNEFNKMNQTLIGGIDTDLMNNAFGRCNKIIQP